MRAMLCAAALTLALASTASASDSSLKRAVGGYRTALTRDIAALSNFTVPSGGSASAVLRSLTRDRGDLVSLRSTLLSQHASSARVNHGRGVLLGALGTVDQAISAAASCAHSVRSGQGSAARQAQASEQRLINSAIPRLQAGGRLLGLF